MKKINIIDSIQSFQKKTLPLYYVQIIKPRGSPMAHFYSKKYKYFVVSDAYYKPISKI